MTPSEIKPTEHSEYFGLYIGQAPQLDLIPALENTHQQVLDFLNQLPKDKHEFQYAADKWTIKEMLLHMIDTERIFAYRALRIARKDKAALLGYEQDDYVGPSKANNRSWENLIQDYKITRANTISLFNSFDEEMLLEIGTASNNPMSTRAAAYIISGHELHHLNVIRERYL